MSTPEMITFMFLGFILAPILSTIIVYKCYRIIRFLIKGDLDTASMIFLQIMGIIFIPLIFTGCVYLTSLAIDKGVEAFTISKLGHLSIPHVSVMVK